MNAAEQIAALQAASKPVRLFEDIGADSPDHGLIAAFNKRQEALAVIESRGTFYSCGDHSPAEQGLFDHFDMIVSKWRSAATVQGAIVRLWVAFSHTGEGWTEALRVVGDVVRRADMDEIATFETSLDLDQQCLFRAIRDLTAIARGGGGIMASHPHTTGGPPGLPLSVLLGAIPSLPRPLLARLTARMIDRLDEIDGDENLEDATDLEDEGLSPLGLRYGSHGPGCSYSDPGGGNIEDERQLEEGGIYPTYGIDQSEGRLPIFYPRQVFDL